MQVSALVFLFLKQRMVLVFCEIEIFQVFSCIESILVFYDILCNAMSYNELQFVSRSVFKRQPEELFIMIDCITYFLAFKIHYFSIYSPADIVRCREFSFSAYFFVVSTRKQSCYSFLSERGFMSFFVFLQHIWETE